MLVLYRLTFSNFNLQKKFDGTPVISGHLQYSIQRTVSAEEREPFKNTQPGDCNTETSSHMPHVPKASAL